MCFCVAVVIQQNIMIDLFKLLPSRSSSAS